MFDMVVNTYLNLLALSKIWSSSLQRFFLQKRVLKLWSKFRGEHQLRRVISIKLLCNFIEITLRHTCKFAAHFQNTLPKEHLWKVPSEKLRRNHPNVFWKDVGLKNSPRNNWSQCFDSRHFESEALPLDSKFERYFLLCETMLLYAT